MDTGGFAGVDTPEPFPFVVFFIGIAEDTVIISKIVDIVLTFFVWVIEMVCITCSNGVGMVIESK